MRVYQKGGTEKCRLIDYAAFVSALRIPLEGRRLAVVKQAFDQIGGGDAVTVGAAKGCFAYEEFDKFNQELLGWVDGFRFPKSLNLRAGFFWAIDNNQIKQLQELLRRKQRTRKRRTRPSKTVT